MRDSFEDESMPTQQKIDELKAELSKVTKYKDKQLTSRAEWGTIGFQMAGEDIEMVFSIATDLTELPLQYLTDNAIHNILNCLPAVTEQLQSIDNFDLTGDAGSNRNQISKHLRGAAERLTTEASPHIPYLAYRRGDISDNIAALNLAVAQAEELLDEARTTTEGKVEEIDGIISAARDAAASVGVATFTQEFDTEATDLKDRSRSWLFATGAFAVLTIGAAILFYRWPEVSLDAGAWETLRNVVSKAAIIAVLFTGTVWCGRIYRALMHQATINRHRALSLKTFQAFVAATDDDRIKDSVLMAATRTVFGRVPTGLVNDNGSGQESEVNFVEIGRTSSERVVEAAVDS